MSVLTLEVPAAYLDDLALSSSSSPRLRLVGRNPEPGEGAVLTTTQVRLTVLDLGASPGLATGATQVFLNGVPAFASGTPLAGYNGAGSGSTVLGGGSAYSQAIVLTPLAPLDTLLVVTVRVVTHTTDTAASIDTSYVFMVQDLVAPRLTAAAALGHNVVRLTFNEPVLQADGTGTHDALNPANYAFDRLTSPAVAVTARSVRSVSATVVEVLTDVDLSPGAGYAAIATSLDDIVGNQVAPPYNRAEFTGFRCPVPAGRAFSLYRLLPSINRSEDEAGTGDLARFMACLQEPVDLLLCDIDRWTDILDPDFAPQPFLDRMLFDLGNPFRFAADLDEIGKRRLVQVLVAIYREKGTAVGIVNVIRFFLGVEVTVQNLAVDDSWILGESLLGVGTFLAPSTSFLLYAFTVTSPVVLTAAQRDQLRQIVLYMKPAHTHFVELLEPVAPPEEINHLELGLSSLGENWNLH